VRTKRKSKRTFSNQDCVVHEGKVTHEHTGKVIHEHVFSFPSDFSFINHEDQPVMIVKHIIASEKEDELEDSFQDPLKTRHCTTPTERIEKHSSFKVTREGVTPVDFLNFVQNKSKTSYTQQIGLYMAGAFSGAVATIGFFTYNFMQQQGCTDLPSENI
jgi:hypothetical protein